MQADIDRIVAIWHDARERFGQHGPWLFGRFSAADAMYAPVVWRFITYNVPLPEGAAAYRDAMLELPAMRSWQAGALAERSCIEACDSLAAEHGGPAEANAGRPYQRGQLLEQDHAMVLDLDVAAGDQVAQDAVHHLARCAHQVGNLLLGEPLLDDVMIALFLGERGKQP